MSSQKSWVIWIAKHLHVRHVFLHSFAPLQVRRICGKRHAPFAGLPHKTHNLKNLISSSLGGFRKFYANCFSVIASHEAFHSDSIFSRPDGSVEADNTSDFMWVVDVHYDNKPIFSKIVWGIPYAGNFPDWYLQSPFQTDIINLEDVDADEDGLPTIMSVDELGKDGNIWRRLMENIKLSWIVINKRTGQAANLSSWSPLDRQRHSTSNVKFLVHFGSLLPAVEISPYKVVKCIIEMKCRVSATTLKMSEVCVRLEDMSGNDVNGSKGLGILGRALCYKRSNDRNKILELHRTYFGARSNIKEVRIPTEGHPRTVWVIISVIACISFYYLTSRLGTVVAKD